MSQVRTNDVLMSCFVVLALALIIGQHVYRKEQYEFEQVKEWLGKHKLSQYADLFYEKEYTSLYKVSQLNKLKVAILLKKSFLHGKPKQTMRYVSLILQAKEQMVRENRYSTWLSNNKITHLQNEFKSMGIETLEEVIANLENLKGIEFMEAYQPLIDLEINKDSLQQYPIFYSRWTLRNILWTVFSLLSWLVKLVLTFSVIVVVVTAVAIKSIVGSILAHFNLQQQNRRNVYHNPGRPGIWDVLRQLFVRPNQNRNNNGTVVDGAPPRQDQNFGFFDSLLGRNFSPQASTVSWNTNELAVGNEIILTVQFYARNRRPYQASNLTIKCEVLCYRSFVETAVVHSQENTNQIDIHFTPIVAGSEYVISILADGQNVGVSPYKRTFVPAGIDPSKSSLVVPSSLLVLEEDKQEELKFDERDKYGNLVVSEVEDLLNYQFIVHEFKEDGKRVYPTLSFNANVVDVVSKHPTSAWLKVKDAGVYTIDVLYNDQPFSKSVVLLVLTKSQMSEVNKNITTTPYSLYYEAIMYSAYKEQRRSSIVHADDPSLPNGYERIVTAVEPSDTAKRKKVYCYISPKFFTIKEFYMKIFTKKQYVYRIKPSVKISLHSSDPAEGGECFTIQSSSTGQSITLYCTQRNVVVATFVKLLLKNVGGSENFQDKKRYFQAELQKFGSAQKDSKVQIKVNRETLLKDSMSQVKYFYKLHWWKQLNINFEGEMGMDWGGLSREWFHLVLGKLFNTEGGLFRRFDKDNSQALIHPNPYRKEEFQKLRMYEFAGQMIAKCLIECSCGQQRQQYVKARFTRSFLAQLLGVEITWKFFETDDKALYNGKVKHILENDPTDLDIYFCEDVYDNDDNLIKTVDLKPYGSTIQVVEENKMEYLQKMAEYRLQDSVKQEIASFSKGLNSTVDDGLLSIFDENELELLMCGMDVISVADMKANSDVTNPNSEQMNQFWSILSGFSQEELSRLLQFITGCSQLPPEGFAGLSPKLQLRFAFQGNYLPVSHTCMNLLLLPAFDTTDELRRKIILAITEGSESEGLV